MSCQDCGFSDERNAYPHGHPWHHSEADCIANLRADLAAERAAALSESQAQLRFIFERVLCFSAGMANHRLFYKRLDGTANTVTGPTFEACLKLAMGDPR